MLTAVVSNGAVIYDSGVTVLSAKVSVQSGRLSRNGITSDWATPVSFPGIVNAGAMFGYEAFDIPVSPFPYLQVSFYDVLNATNLFASAYENAYLPTGTSTNLGFDTNFLGYAGSSGNLYGNPRAFQVVLPNPMANHLVVVVNDTSTSAAGVNQPFEVIVEGFYDTNFTDTMAFETPEPSSMFLSGAGLVAGLIWVARKRPRPA